MSSYCTDSYDDSDILQGDIFKKINPEGEDELFLIISADCDIANNKLGRSGLACLSILNLENYFFNEHCASKHQKQIDTQLNKLVELINSHWLSLSNTHKRIDGKNIVNWIKDEEIDAILSILKIDKKDTIAKIKASYNIIKKYTDHKSTKECKDIDLLTIVNGKDHLVTTNNNEIIKKYMTELSKSPPQDLFFIPSIPTLDDIGYVVKLRSLFFAPTSHCFTSSSKAKESPVSYIRIGRLTPTFKHALAQQFGTLFSRIGFPTYYEHDVKDSFAIFLDKY
ncbi:MAG: hypothetical protein K0S90_63 [Enterobacteriaceae bacterium]|jgi:hypothetical protein|uniref:hypothetical protein n=1 Tax=Pseudescherichia sp. TaxID=2055881 RepID=UPI00289D9659|nr:hypothetical protein [Pseudescherichia sp.]MDF2776540.1 hypothetical protein [Enterobacteriaceae bacterium]